MANIRRRNGRYQVQIRRRGFPSQVKTFSRHIDAKRWALEAELRLERGELEPHPTTVHHTIGELLKRYQVTFQLDTAEYWRTVVLERAFGSCYVTGLRPSDLAKYRDERLCRIQPATLARELKVLRRVFRIAHDEWDVPLSLDAFSRLSIKQQSLPRERRLEPGELDRLLDACAGAQNLWLRPTVELALETGMRRGELLNARYEHLYHGLLHIPKTKTGHPRTIPLTPRASVLIGTLPHPISGHILPMTTTALRHSFDRAKRRAGIEDFHFHDLRHEAISRFFEMGLSIPEVALISGHKDQRMLARYTHLRATDVRDKLARATTKGA